MNTLNTLLSAYGLYVSGAVALALIGLVVYRTIEIRLASRRHSREVAERWNRDATAALAALPELREENRNLQLELARVRDFYGVVTTGLQAENNRLQQSSLH